MPQACTQLPHEADHIRAQKHKGPTTLQNLCWACALCNSHKGSDASAYVPGTDELVRLFNPRIDSWDDHFEWVGPRLMGQTDIALATLELLRINTDSRVSVFAECRLPWACFRRTTMPVPDRPASSHFRDDDFFARGSRAWAMSSNTWFCNGATRSWWRHPSS